MLVPVLALAFTAGSACAEESSSAGNGEAAAASFGSTTRDWTQLQASGSAASRTARPLPGDAAKNIYDRYADSFKHPIPEKFDRDSFTTKEK
ncbi:DUF3613 domain-containing protein [Nevskia sp.]|uniref:DUF3613 domain-containing protein n=1 Tax=Nevskia sp. TaxID=1929292 RepID=UPI0025DFF49F|nr:DUF3613 domain-containing protein [Nevskia sp.]